MIRVDKVAGRGHIAHIASKLTAMLLDMRNLVDVLTELAADDPGPTSPGFVEPLGWERGTVYTFVVDESMLPHIATGATVTVVPGGDLTFPGTDWSVHMPEGVHYGAVCEMVEAGTMVDVRATTRIAPGDAVEFTDADDEEVLARFRRVS